MDFWVEEDAFAASQTNKASMYVAVMHVFSHYSPDSVLHELSLQFLYTLRFLTSNQLVDFLLKTASLAFSITHY